jgi:hypothetical protein
VRKVSYGVSLSLAVADRLALLGVGPGCRQFRNSPERAKPLSPVEREKKLTEGAKKEGRGVIYSSENVTLLQDTKRHLPSVIPFSK